MLSFIAGSTSCTSELTLDLLCEEVVPNTTEWKAIARKLKISPTIINFIAQDMNSSKDRFVKVLEQWRRECRYPFTWNTMVSVLKSSSVNEVRLAEHLYRKYCTK